METNRSRLVSLARDLRSQEPRPAYEKLGGFEMAARTLDKCRADLLGIQGDYTFGCPLDREFFESTGIDIDSFRQLVAGGATDNEVADWLQQQADRRL